MDIFNGVNRGPSTSLEDFRGFSKALVELETVIYHDRQMLVQRYDPAVHMGRTKRGMALLSCYWSDP